MLAKLDQLANRLVELDELLMHEGATSNMDSYRKMTRSTPRSARWWPCTRSSSAPRATSPKRREMLSDPDMKEFAQEEIEAAKGRVAYSSWTCKKCCCRKTSTTSATSSSRSAPAPAATRSALFAGDLLRMYTRFAERNRWQVEMVSESASDLGGYREVIVRLIGNGAYSKLKFESGGHRVQRVLKPPKPRAAFTPRPAPWP
ncbi:PCRF domain-containing protein [Massilia sp. H-1]|nr:PCRF domain-containing protein [Massilia sp. H-1]